VRAVALGSVRWYLRLAPVIESLLSHPKGVANEVRCLLVVAAHQVEYSRNAPQPTVHAAVDATRALKHPGAAGLVNAVLRRFVANHRALLDEADASVSIRTAHPAWLIEAIEAAWPEQAESIFQANNAHPPMVLRVDRSRGSVSDYLAELAAAGMAGHALEWAGSAVRLDKPVPLASLPGFAEGRVSVQDAGAQLAPKLLDVRPGMRVLDACAAPGGKTGHILESVDGPVDLVAVDIDAGRAGRIRENLERLRRSAQVLVGDLRDPGSFWDGKPFDRILVDAPCSSTGVIRRHPDIKLLRWPRDVGSFARTQGEILAAAFSMLAPGGRLVYCTCSVLPAENEAVVNAFLAAQAAQPLQGAPPRQGTARAVQLAPAAELAPGACAGCKALERHPGLQLLPTEAGADGFYYACLEKTTAPI
jgi:16S rRNA (cytosine967-C5)-methyltransferase